MHHRLFLQAALLVVIIGSLVALPRAANDNRYQATILVSNEADEAPSPTASS